MKRSLEPVWKEDWEAVVEEAMDQTLDLDMWDKFSFLIVVFPRWDKDHVGADEFMGRATIPLSKLTDNGKSDQWVRIMKLMLRSSSAHIQVELEEASSGQVRIQSLWMPIVPRREGTQTVLQVLDEFDFETESSIL